MRYLAQFSEAPRGHRVQSFWSDVRATEDWLLSVGKSVEERLLVLRARGIRALEHWLPYQSQPLLIDAWLDPMEISATWSYLGPFLVELGPERIWIPCGEDAWIGWMPGRIVVRAARESWVWALVEDVWDPASWHPQEELEWWSEGRIQRAQQMGWGVVEQRSWLTGWEEWTLIEERQEERARGRFSHLWFRLVEKLGARSVRVKWFQETASRKEQLLGIDVRYVSCELSIKGEKPGWIDPLERTPEPTHIRTEVTWRVPRWSPLWATEVTLRRVQRGSRLEAMYSPRHPDRLNAWLELRREQRQIPILQIRPLSLHTKDPNHWVELARECGDHQSRDRLAHFLNTGPWPQGRLSDSERVRMTRGWHINRFESQPGLWVVESARGIQVQIEWPTSAHPGHLGIVIGQAQPIAMSEWTRSASFERLNVSPRYWAKWCAEILLPMLDNFPGA